MEILIKLNFPPKKGDNNLEIEVLVSCMNEKDLSIINKLNLQSNAVIINQTDYNSYTEIKLNNYNIKFISSNQRGLTRSRNLALAYATGDICILCDDDVQYYSGYKEKILRAFDELPDADIIIFDIERINYNGFSKPLKKVRKAPLYKSYGSVRIAFRRKSIEENNLWFDINFGSGSIFSSGEETIFLNQARRKQLKIYEYPAVIARVDFRHSTWREGYNEKFFYDKGALLGKAYPAVKYIFMFYYLSKLKKSSPLSNFEILKWLLNGIKGSKLMISYENFRKNYKNGEKTL